MEMHYEIGERDNSVLSMVKKWRMHSSVGSCLQLRLSCVASTRTASLSVLSRNSAAIIRPRCEKSISEKRHRSSLSLEIVRHPD